MLYHLLNRGELKDGVAEFVQFLVKVMEVFASLTRGLSPVRSFKKRSCYANLPQLCNGT